MHCILGPEVLCFLALCSTFIALVAVLAEVGTEHVRTTSCTVSCRVLPVFHAPCCRLQRDHICAAGQECNSERVGFRGAAVKLTASAAPVELLSDTPQLDSARSGSRHSTLHGGLAARACFGSVACKSTLPVLIGHKHACQHLKLNSYKSFQVYIMLGLCPLGTAAWFHQATVCICLVLRG